MPPLLKMAVEFGPLMSFFGAYSLTDLLTATATLMVATVIALGISYAIERRVAIMPLVSGTVLMFFGGLTLILKDPRFVMMKPTIVNLLFAGVLVSGLAFRRLFLRMLLGEAIQMQERGWRILTYRWIGFFICLAILNEVVWRTFSEEFWVSFKVWGIFPLTLVFTAAQVPLISKYQSKDGSHSEENGHGLG
jgi:intracellular septation protein